VDPVKLGWAFSLLGCLVGANPLPAQAWLIGFKLGPTFSTLSVDDPNDWAEVKNRSSAIFAGYVISIGREATSTP
jgi:hypothetical protein